MASQKWVCISLIVMMLSVSICYAHRVNTFAFNNVAESNNDDEQHRRSLGSGVGWGPYVGASGGGGGGGGGVGWGPYVGAPGGGGGPGGYYDGRYHGPGVGADGSGEFDDWVYDAIRQFAGQGGQLHGGGGGGGGGSAVGGGYGGGGLGYGGGNGGYNVPCVCEGLQSFTLHLTPNEPLSVFHPAKSSLVVAKDDSVAN